MAQVTQKVVEIKAKVEGEKTVKMLKDQIAELTHLMDTLDTESLEYHRTVDMLVDAQEELNTVMKAGKSQLSAQEGSYNALVNRMAALKKAQKAVTDEASRMRLGDEIRKINDQLKEIDANNGVYVRNVGNYENAIKSALKTPQQELKALRQQLAQLTEGTAEYNAVFARMADLTHKVTEQQEMLKWSSADLGDILGNVAGVATSLAGGFSAFNALGGLLGMGENEDMEKAMLQAQRFIQLIQGLEQLEQLADKIKGMWTGIKNFNTATSGAATTLSEFGEASTAAAGSTNTFNSTLTVTQGTAQQTAKSVREAATEVKVLTDTVSTMKEFGELQESLQNSNDELIKYANNLSLASDKMIAFTDSNNQLLVSYGEGVDIVRDASDSVKRMSVLNTNLMKTNLHLKDSLATTHKWQLLTRAATKAQIKENEALIVGNTLLATSFKVATIAAKTLKVAIASTGIGLLIVGIGELLTAIGGWLSGSKKAEERTNDLKASVESLNGSLEIQDRYWKRREALMKAQGATDEELYEAEKKVIEAKLAETQATLAANKAIAAEIGYRKLQKDKYEEFRNTLKELEEQEKALKDELSDFNWYHYCEQVEAARKADEEKAKAAQKAREAAISNYNKQKEEAEKLYKQTIEFFKDEKTKLKEKYEEEKKLLEKFGKDTTLLTRKYEQDKTAIVLKESEARAKAAREYNKLIEQGFKNPSFEYFDNQLSSAIEKMEDFMEVYNAANVSDSGYQVLAEDIQYLNETYGLAMKGGSDFLAYFKIVQRELENAQEALANYQKQVAQEKSDKRVAEIEKEITALQNLMDWESQQYQNAYDLYMAENNYYTDFTNNYISQMYLRWDAEDAIYQQRMFRMQQEVDMYKAAAQDITLTEEARLEALAKANAIERQMAQESADYMIAANTRKVEATDNYMAAVQDSLGGISQILGDVASAWETSIQAQVDAGEISEEEGEKQMESMRGIQSAIALINAFSSAVSAYNSLASIPYVGVPLGIAASAAALASGLAQVAAINKVKKGDKGSGSSVRYAEVTPTVPDYSPTGIMNVTGGKEQEDLANAITKAPIYVTVKDIDTAQNRVRVREKESTF